MGNLDEIDLSWVRVHPGRRVKVTVDDV